MTAAGLIAALGLSRHPEGGWYNVHWKADGQGRPAATSIHFLLQAGEVSHWHWLDADELWLFQAGAPLTLLQAVTAEGPALACTLGPDVAAGQRPQALVPAGRWQSARSLGDWTLVGCVMVPGWIDAGFTLAPPDFDIPR